jgi:hypothetical protein
MDFNIERRESIGMFFSAYCQETGTEVLLGPDNFVDLADGPLGVELHYRCYCGEVGVLYPKHPGALKGSATSHLCPA